MNDLGEKSTQAEFYFSSSHGSPMSDQSDSFVESSSNSYSNSYPVVPSSSYQPASSASPPTTPVKVEQVLIDDDEDEERKTSNSDGLERPEHSYARLAAMAIDNSPGKRATVGEIYQWIEANFPYYRNGAPWWKNCIRHNLSMKKNFARMQMDDRNYWVIQPEHWDDIMRQPRSEDRRVTPRKRARASVDADAELMRSPKASRSPKTRPSPPRKGISKAEASPTMIPRPPVAAVTMSPHEVNLHDGITAPVFFTSTVIKDEPSLEEVWLPVMQAEVMMHSPMHGDSEMMQAHNDMLLFQSRRGVPALPLEPPEAYLDNLESWSWDLPITSPGE